MIYKNNKLAPSLANKGLRRSLEIIERNNPTLFHVVHTIIIAIGKPIMALRAGFYKATGGYFTNSSIPWLKISIVLIGAYILSYKNLNFNLNLNSTPNTLIPDYATMSISNSLPPIVSATFDDKANEKYIDEYKQLAIQEMKVFGIPASIKLGQALLESEAGSSSYAASLNNHFNLRCGKSNAGTCVETTNGLFKEFDTVYDGWRANSKFLVTNEYARLRKEAGNNYKIWAAGLDFLGYSSEKDYAEKLIGIIEYYELQKFDLIN